MGSRTRPVLAMLLVLWAISGFSQTTETAPSPSTAQPASKPQIKKVPASYTNPSSGRQMYDAYCASCHGQGGTGNGPAAPALRVSPTDLTQLAAKNGGSFPGPRVAQVIKGDLSMPAHGSKEMPVWGPVFLYLDQ